MNLYASLDGDVWATVLESIKTSASNRRKTLRISSRPGEMEAFLRPYIILRSAKRNMMKQADVAIAFVGHFIGYRPHTKKRSTKASRHTMKKRGYRATAQDRVCQSLGCIAQENKKLFIQELGFADCTSWVILRAIITGCIRHSCQVWGLHLAGNTRRA